LKLLLFISLLPILFWYSQAKENGPLPNVHNWNIYYNDSLIYSTSPIIDNPTWETDRWQVYELQLTEGSWNEQDSIRINYSSDVIRSYTPIVVIKDDQGNELLRKEGEKQFFMEDLRPFISEHTFFSICYGQVATHKNNAPDFSKTYINEYLKIIIEK
jgi:hypothetical protein